MYACRVRAFVRPSNVTATAIMIMMHSEEDGTVPPSVPGHPYPDDLYRCSAEPVII